MEPSIAMTSKLFSDRDKDYADHPKFSGVKMAVFVTGNDTDTVSVCQLIIAPGIAIPVHAHDPQVDSIFIVSGNGEAYVNGEWREVVPGDYLFFPSGVEHATRNTGSEKLILLVHHSPPLL
jgi:quercetin dioxygenase-like cupin family protein